MDKSSNCDGSAFSPSFATSVISISDAVVVVFVASAGASIVVAAVAVDDDDASGSLSGEYRCRVSLS